MIDTVTYIIINIYIYNNTLKHKSHAISKKLKTIGSKGKTTLVTRLRGNWKVRD